MILRFTYILVDGKRKKMLKNCFLYISFFFLPNVITHYMWSFLDVTHQIIFAGYYGVSCPTVGRIALGDDLLERTTNTCEGRVFEIEKSNKNDE